MKAKHEQVIIMSVQVKCEDHNHEKCSIKLNINSFKHGNMKNHQRNYLTFKVYVCLVQTKEYIHIQKLTSPQIYMHEGTWLKRIFMYI